MMTIKRDKVVIDRSVIIQGFELILFQLRSALFFVKIKHKDKSYMWSFDHFFKAYSFYMSLRDNANFRKVEITQLQTKVN